MRHACALMLLLSAPASAAPCKLAGKPWLAAAHPDARAGESVDLRLVGRVHVAGRTRLLDGEDWRQCDGLEVIWRRQEPRMQHTETPSPNKDIAVYANAVVFGASHGTWIGYDTIEYFETPLGAFGPTLSVHDASPTENDLLEKRLPEHRTLGVMRVAATVKLDGGDAKSTEPFRYTFRAGDDFLGWLTSFYNVPYLFGSAGKGAKNQAERYIGADCADILVAALRRAGWHKMEYSSVADLVDALHPVARPTLVKPCEGGVCAPASPPIRFGREVRVGDLLALDYVGADADLPREWDHIVTVVADRGPDGQPDGLLGPEDLVADSGSAEGLKVAPLGDQGLVRAAVLRPR